jgi:hypothetical protein
MPPYVVEKCAIGNRTTDRHNKTPRCEAPRYPGSRYCAEHRIEALARIKK